ncbi:glycosyltransferase [Thalassospira sp. A3_1]|uniref:glycosyltransferase family protein n=1 Tax=Thalassospira sp. A3_1 TaxID=2821088 RepID=UPI001ADD5D1C|nr:glycosyltransferase [Thalassospira sp. A3_1]MBO9508334.1 glycosyltransferase family 1 protein [Thalassospira sp. A3_1]
MLDISRLRILHVTNYSLTPKVPGYYGVPYKITNGFTRLGHNVLPFGDRDLARLLNIFRSRKFGIPQLNKKLLEVVEKFEPDMIVFGHADMITRSTLEKIKEKLPSVKIAQWNVDPLFSSDNVGRIKSKIDLVDATFCSTDGPLLTKLSEGKYRTYFMPNPVDMSIERHRNFEYSREELSFDFGMAIGTPNEIRNICGEDYIVQDLLDDIAKSSSRIRASFPGYTSPRITCEEYDKYLSKTSMSLNFSRRNDAYLYSSDRIAQTVGNGILTFVDRATGLNDDFEEDQMAFFSNKDELITKISYFIDNDKERQNIAKRSWHEYHRKFNEKIIADNIIKNTYNEHH